MKPGYVLGNGKTRLFFDLERMKKNGRVYGCNALYRDFTPDVLVATDIGIATEIEDSGYPLENVFYTRKPRLDKGSRLIEYHYGFSSGPIALKLAALKHEIIYMCGFDLAGDRGMQNNVYSGTPNYRPSDDPATYYGNWVDQIATIVNEHPEVTFARVCGVDSIVPMKWFGLKNFKMVMTENFMENITGIP